MYTFITFSINNTITIKENTDYHEILSIKGQHSVWQAAARWLMDRNTPGDCSQTFNNQSYIVSSSGQESAEMASV